MNKNDEKIIVALLLKPTIKEAAEHCGVSESLIYTRLKNESFKEKYEAERRKLLETNTAKLQGHISSAVDAMGEIVSDTSNAPQIRLNAADAIIRNSLKLTEQTEILRRLDELEKNINK